MENHIVSPSAQIDQPADSFGAAGIISMWSGRSDSFQGWLRAAPGSQAAAREAAGQKARHLGRYTAHLIAIRHPAVILPPWPICCGW